MEGGERLAQRSDISLVVLKHGDTLVRMGGSVTNYHVSRDLRLSCYWNNSRTLVRGVFLSYS
jgi:hypothetical protein